MSAIPAPTRGFTPTERFVPPATPTIEDICDRAGAVVNSTSALAGEVADLHDSAISTSVEAEVLHIRELAQTLAAASSTVELLDRLADLGLAWRDIAALAGVSVPAVRKWRQGGASSGPNRIRVAELVALLTWLEEDKLVVDVASWLEIPLAATAPINRLDLLVGARTDLLIESLTGGETPAESILDQFDPGWRGLGNSDFEVFEADDGQRSIRRREGR